MIIEKLDLPILLLRTKPADFPVPLEHLSPEGQVCTFRKNAVEFVTFVQAALLPVLTMQHLIHGEILPTMKQISNCAASDPKSLPMCMPHPARDGLKQRDGIGLFLYLGNWCIHNIWMATSSANIWSSGEVHIPKGCLAIKSWKSVSKRCQVGDWIVHACRMAYLSIGCMGWDRDLLAYHLGSTTNNGWWWGPRNPKFLSKRMTVLGCILLYWTCGWRINI